MNTEKNEAVARYFDRIGKLEEQHELLAAAAGLLKEVGWVQGHNAVDENGDQTESLALNAARFSVSSALIRTSRETGLDRTMAVKTAIDGLADRIRASHPRAHAFEAEETETRPTIRNLSVVMAWNNDPDQSIHEVVRTLLETSNESADVPPRSSETGTPATAAPPEAVSEATPEAAPEAAPGTAPAAAPAALSEAAQADAPNGAPEAAQADALNAEPAERRSPSDENPGDVASTRTGSGPEPEAHHEPLPGQLF